MSTKISTKINNKASKQVGTKVPTKVSMKTQETALKFNALKWLLIIVLLVSGVVANIYYAAQPASMRLAAWALVAGVVAMIATSTQEGQRARHFLRDAKIELRKVVWPSRQETIRTTMMVVVMVLIASLLLWGIDAVLVNLIGWLTGQ